MNPGLPAVLRLRPGRGRLSLAALVLTLPWALPCSARAESARADKPVVVVVPVGQGAALLPTAAVAQSITLLIERWGNARPRLVYPPPQDPSAAIDSASARQHMEQAEEAFQALEFDAVRQHATAALEVFRAEVASGGTSDGYVEALHLLAATEFFDGQQDAAERAMNDAVIFDPRPPAQERFNPTVQQFHQQVLEQASDEGHLSVTSSPEGLLWLNGRLMGSTTETRALRPGLYWVRIFSPGHAAWRDWVRVAPGEPRQLSVTLESDTQQAEPPVVPAARRRSEGQALPGAANALLREQRATELVVVDARPGCNPQACTLVVGHSSAGRWQADAVAPLDRPLEGTAARLLRGTAWSVGGATQSTAGLGDALKTCVTDSECSLHLRCRRGVCTRANSITRRWWFWTAIGVSAAAVAVGVALPFVLPEKVTIEVR
ncbi:MAG: PEGA domain-containing protein [Proteobacteria bacterium]|nr:PEGA domain-containing protein [Pseudomonadota bacterium]